MLKPIDTIFSIILILCCILNLIALCHTFYKFCIEKKTKISRLTQYVVITTMILLSSHTMTHTIFQFFDHKSYKLTTFACKLSVIIISISFYIGKSLLLCFYIIRSAISFKNSELAYSNKHIFIYCIIIIVIGLISTIGWPFIQLPFTKSSIDSDGDYYCIVSAATEDNYNYHHANTYFLIYATLIEIIVSIWTVWLFVGRLIQRSFSSYLNRKKSYEQNINVTTMPLSGDDDDNDDNINSLNALDFNNSTHVEIWYKSTNQMNNILLLITKLLLLLLISIITSQIALILFLTVIPRAYAMDSCINVYCMYLSFGFTEKIWRNLFCGNQCIECSFPFIKMCAFTTCTMNICCIRCSEKRELMMNNDDSNDSDGISPKYKDHDQCGCSVYNQEQKWMRSMIRNEYQLFIRN